MKESRKEFIKKAHSAACNDWRQNIEKEFPELFKEDALVVGKWYKRKKDLNLWFLTHINNGCSFGYGFDYSGYWADELTGFNYSLELNRATDKEVEQALIKEAKTRGFKKNVVIITSKTGVKRTLNSNNFEMIGNNLVCLSSKGSYIYSSVFTNGKWAEIIKETITKEQAEKELGKTILN